MDGENYVSMFKINGVPILPPLMTAARRREMRAYRELAVALEARLKLEAKQKQEIAAEQEVESVSTIEDEYMKVSSMLQDHFSPAKLPRQIDKKEESPESLQKSDTFIYDINTNTVMIPKEKDAVLNDEILDICNTVLSSMNSVDTSDISPNKIESSPKNEKKPSKLSRYVSPVISIDPSPPEGKNASHEAKQAAFPIRKNIESSEPAQRASTSPALKDSPQPPPLVRSNSFTLENPSPVLLRHMVRHRSRNAGSPEDHKVEVVGTPPKELPRRTTPTGTKACEAAVVNQTAPSSRPRAQANSLPNAVSESTKLSSIISYSNMIKAKKSPYDIKLGGKPKVAKKHKMPLKRISSVSLKPRLSTTHHHRPRLLTASQSPENQVPTNEPKRTTPATLPHKIDNADLLRSKVREIEEQHRLRLLQLMKQQKEEQRIMQEQFERQQKQLLDEFNAGLMSLQGFSELSLEETNADTPKIQKGLTSEDNTISSPRSCERTPNDDSQSYDMTSTLAPSIAKAKTPPGCSRRLFTGWNSASTPRQRGVPVLSSFMPASAKESIRVQSPMTNRKKDRAATIINAYARGFLVRRLFRTEHVQNIVQTIRDTLIFVLDFHRETEHDTSEENIMFKARLLQQLTSASQSLKTVFSLPTKDKMQLIARDRIYIQNKAKAQNKYNRKG